jgi:hypothetical protein
VCTRWQDEAVSPSGCCSCLRSIWIRSGRGWGDAARRFRAAWSRERLPAAVDHRVDTVEAGGAAPASVIGDEVLPGRVATAGRVLELLAPTREPGLEPAAVAGNAGRGDAVLFGIGETVGQRCHDGLGTASTRYRGPLRCTGAAREAQQQARWPDSAWCSHGPSYWGSLDEPDKTTCVQRSQV